MIFLESLFKRLLTLSLLIMGGVFFYKDQLPAPDFYDINLLEEPLQQETGQAPFTTQAGGQTYTITPKYDYELHGVVVSYNNADSITDIWHHKRWQDFLNERDLCVIWGENVKSGVYKQMRFENDSWTCWAYWPDSATGQLFKFNSLSNNHVLIDNAQLRKSLMNSEIGDHIRFKGVLAEYANKANGFYRGTSNNRDDTGNGACETVFLNEFEIIKKANPGLRRVYAVAKGIALFVLIGFLLLFFTTPFRIKS
jgi:hypothetical protein